MSKAPKWSTHNELNFAEAIKSIMNPPSYIQIDEVHERGVWDVPDSEYPTIDDDGNIISIAQTIDIAAFADLPLVHLPEKIDTTDIAAAEARLDHAFHYESSESILKSAVQLAAISANSIASLSSDVFSEILQCLSPEAMVERYTRMQYEFSPGLARIMQIAPTDRSGRHHYAKTFVLYLRILIQARHTGDQSLSVEDYKHLLKCTRAVGDTNTSRVLLRIMARDGLTPDLECFNHHLSTLTWAELLNNYQRHKVRVTPRHLKIRMFPRRPRAFERSFEGHRVGRGGIREEVTGIFDDMVGIGVMGDEESFCCLLIAMAREGYVQAMSSTLRQVWNIDVEVLRKKEDYEQPPVTEYERDSPFFPTQKLLFCVAHAYGINNDVPSAFRLVDYISRSYSIDISVDVWAELLERSFHLATIWRGQRGRDPDMTLGQLARDAVTSLWESMNSEPYNIKPTIAMYDKIIKNEILRGAFSEALKLMLEAKQQMQDLNIQWARSEDQGSLSARDLVYHNFVHKRHRKYLELWCRTFLKRGSQRYRGHEGFSGSKLPEFIKEWRAFLPNVIEYCTPTGRVMFDKWQLFNDVSENDPRLVDRRMEVEQWMEDQLANQGYIDDSDDFD